MSYPPGVTGNEYEIAGPDFDEDAEEHCETCEAVTQGTRQGYSGERWFICGTCNLVTDLEPIERDPDE